MQSDNRKIKRGRLTSLYLETIKKTLFYRLTNRGYWLCVNSQSSPQMSKYQMTQQQQKQAI